MLARRAAARKASSTSPRALQRRAQETRTQAQAVYQGAEHSQDQAAEVWDRAGWLRDVELPARIAAIERRDTWPQ